MSASGSIITNRVLRRILAVSQKETFHILRDTRTLILAFVMPVILILIFGYGVSFEVEHTPIGIMDLENSQNSRQVIRSFQSSPEFDIVTMPRSTAEIEHAFRNGTIHAAGVIPSDFSTRLARNENAPIQFLLDGSNGTTAVSILFSASGVIQQASRQIAISQGAQIPEPLLQADVTMQYNPALRSSLFFVPGLVAFVIAIAAVLLTSLTVAREWERGNMEQLFATPVSRFEIVSGKLLPYLAVGIAQALLVLAVGATAFDIPVRGNFALLGLAIFIYILAMLGQGVFISVITRSQQLATLAAALTTILPIILLSGFMYPVTNMPKILQGLSLVFPARYFMSILRGLMLKDAGLLDLWSDFLGMTVFATIVVVLSTVKFRRRIA